MRGVTTCSFGVAVTLFCAVPLFFWGGNVLLNYSFVQRNLRVSLNMHLKKTHILKGGTRLLFPRSEVFQLSTEETHWVYWKHPLPISGKRVVLPILFCLQSQSYPFGGCWVYQQWYRLVTVFAWVFFLPLKSETIVTGNMKGEHDRLSLPSVVSVIF